MKDLDSNILHNYLSLIYKEFSSEEISILSKKIKSIFSDSSFTNSKKHLWDEKDCFLITYADSIKSPGKKNLNTLKKFLNKYCKEFSFVHILPFYPYSSDDGFAVVNYEKIKFEHGDWDDFKKLSSNFKIMSDLVINHCSSQNKLFKNFMEKGSWI